ncbi:hypothetical protein CEP52_001368 [Fusarium oligoseptatum]|uniref:Uncharacterized protein n=1 Tax=Fusarium oligoseptatum TaxID=2604345 RepID=A0A428UJB7_9HYPO|nr:hypothetical protein CEP52_001368 [Fusarium oligoseptatum]
MWLRQPLQRSSNVLDDESEFAKLIEEFQTGNTSEMMVNLEDAIENSTQDEGYPHSRTADFFNAPWEAPAPRQHADEPNDATEEDHGLDSLQDRHYRVTGQPTKRVAVLLLAHHAPDPPPRPPRRGVHNIARFSPADSKPEPSLSPYSVIPPQVTTFLDEAFPGCLHAQVTAEPTSPTLAQETFHSWCRCLHIREDQESLRKHNPEQFATRGLLASLLKGHSESSTSLKTISTMHTCFIGRSCIPTGITNTTNELENEGRTNAATLDNEFEKLKIFDPRSMLWSGHDSKHTQSIDIQCHEKFILGGSSRRIFAPMSYPFTLGNKK